MYLHPLREETLHAVFASAPDLLWGIVYPPSEAVSKIKHWSAGNIIFSLASVCNILLFKVSLTHWNVFYPPPQVSLVSHIGRFPSLGLNYNSVAGVLTLHCWFQGVKDCSQNFSFSYCNPKLSTIGQMSRGNALAGWTVDQAVRGTCPFREEPHQMNPCPSPAPCC